MIRRRILAGLALAPLALGYASNAAFAQADYPNKPIHVTIGFAAGSGADILARYYTRKLEILAKQPVILDNKPGASGNIATGTIVKAIPDGYNILFTGNSSITAARHLFKEMHFDTMKDLKPVASFAAITFVLVISPKSPINSVPELVEKLKQKGDNLFGYSNPTGIFSAETIKKITGIPAKPVAYKTTAEAVRDIQDGAIDFMVMDGTFAAAQIKQGALKALGVTTVMRSPTLPDVPPLREAGVPGFDFSPWWSALVPTATPQPVVDKLEGWFHEIAKMPETAEFLATIAAVTQDDGSKAAMERFQKEVPIWPELVKAAGIEPQ
jgi:tripartite-type tricarboxylate transporter receptor subunit TctC